jgi:predicted RNase H-like nuclease
VTDPHVVIGVDAFHSGWVATILSVTPAHREPVRVVHGSTIDTVVAMVGTDFAVVGIDIPIWIPDGGRRIAEVQARQALRPRGATLFITPVRVALEAPTYAQALEINNAVTGEGISAQAYALRAKIFQMRDWRAGVDADVREVHPELSFAAMNGNMPLIAGKKTWNGAHRRRQLLAAEGIVLPDDLGSAGGVPADDILDSAAAAWTAKRILFGQATSLPIGAAGDSDAIWS